MHPLLRLVATRPVLLADHAEAYAGLAMAELGNVVTDWQRRLVLLAVAVCLGGTALVLSGVGGMLWAVTPDAQMRAGWLLLAIPGAAAILALVCLYVGRRPADSAFLQLRQQASADLRLLREAGET